MQKWADQQAHVPKALAEQIQVFLQKDLSQSTLNELFHALKNTTWQETASVKFATKSYWTWSLCRR
ncbi:hypothetical protein ACLMAB_04650 [Brevibacillus laterosporus]